jgi:uncharacterized membrane-anchored protein
MAKTKLLIKVIDELTKYKEILREASVTMKGGKRVDPVHLKALLDGQYTTLNVAISALDLHFKDLLRRQDTPKVADRLRNLKNVFKDKEALKRQRASAQDLFDKGVKEQVKEAKQEADKVLTQLIKEEAFWVKVFSGSQG